MPIQPDLIFQISKIAQCLLHLLIKGSEFIPSAGQKNGHLHDHVFGGRPIREELKVSPLGKNPLFVPTFIARGSLSKGSPTRDSVQLPKARFLGPSDRDHDKEKVEARADH